MENESKDPKVVEVKSEEEFSAFIRSYAMSFGANHFLADMTAEQRTMFLVTVSKTYPNEWNAALQQLGSGHGGSPTTSI